jgi:hypothetical protein
MSEMTEEDRRKLEWESQMHAVAVRNWLGLYVLVLTSAVGTYFFVAPPAIMPLEKADKIAATEIILPFLLGQVAAVFRFYSADSADSKRSIPIPAWAVKAPPIVVTCILLLEFVLMGIGGVTQRETLIPPAESFKALLTFCVALLNASTVFVLGRFFESSGSSGARGAGEGEVESSRDQGR